MSFIGKGVEQRWNAAEDAAVKQQQTSMGSSINMRELVGRSKITLDSILGHGICPKLSEYRRFVNVKSSDIGMIGKNEICTAATNSNPISVNFANFESPPPNNHQSIDTEVPDDTDHGAETYYEGGDDIPMYEDDHPAPPDSPISSSSVATGIQGRESISGAKIAEQTKIQWLPQTEAQKQEIAKQLVEKIPISTPHDPVKNDYSFFEVVESDDNSWAGAPHWKKLRPRRKAAQVNNDTSSISDVSSIGSELNPKEVKTAAGKGKKVTAKKDLKNGGFELTLDLVDASKFGAPSSRSKVDTTIMTKAAIEKAVSSAPSLLLPPDEHLKVHDLCRLFLLPSVIVPPKKISNLIKGSAAAAKNKKNNSSAVGANTRAKALVGTILSGEEEVWGKDEKGLSIIPSTYTNITSQPTIEEHNDVPDMMYDDDGVGFDGGFDVGGTDEPDFTNIPISVHDGGKEEIDKSPTNGNLLSGLSINQDNLVQASRVVEKIDIK